MYLYYYYYTVMCFVGHLLYIDQLNILLHDDSIGFQIEKDKYHVGWVFTTLSFENVLQYALLFYSYAEFRWTF